ncbi:MAG: hypothetical protein Q4A82_07995 [Corynebacterium sp.]|nr:hypothetical protein [Corynebacterium sp.]
MTNNNQEQADRWWNAYLYEGTGVLKNKDDITDENTWHGAERIYTLRRLAILPQLDFHQGSVTD